MVHHKDDLHKNISSDQNDRSKPGYNEDGVLEPVFIVDDDGIPYCKNQTDYEKITKMNFKERFPNEFESMLHCHHCDHYKNDDCYFPKSEIDKIEDDRNHLRIKCLLCGQKIHRIYSILMSLLYKEKYNVNIPVICCTCYSALEGGNFEKNTKRRMILFGVSLATSLYFLFTYFFTVVMFDYLAILLFIIPFAFWGYITVRDAKNLYYLYQGRKKYRDMMNADSDVDEKDLRDKYIDEDEKDKPKDGSFTSPGYEY